LIIQVHSGGLNDSMQRTRSTSQYISGVEI
jgi:hypothetical protein